MKKFLFNSLFLVAAASLGLANNLPNVTAPALPPQIPTEDPITLIGELTPQCQGALLSVVTSPEFFECIPVTALLPLLTDPTLLPSVLQDPIKNGAKLLPAVDAICADPKCSDAGVAAAQKALKEGCSSEQDQKNPIAQLAIAAVTFYSPARDIICFKDSEKEYCTVETIKNILALPPAPVKLLGGVIDKVVFAEPKFICTPCNKAMVNTLIDFFTAHPEALEIIENAFHVGEEELVLGKIGLAVKCGAPFVDGKVGDSTDPPGKFVYQEAGNGTDSSASVNGFNFLMISSLMAASTLVLN
jgi:hypothetical protein